MYFSAKADFLLKKISFFCVEKNAGKNLKIIEISKVLIKKSKYKGKLF
uniref:Uncharacterized protein n=1 Tax=Bacillus cereus HuA4-10 TaxID=1053206 RepID=J8DQH9_BACCE|nr:hypothetical protein IGC_02933 [Bacillus cereus HuA4-10]